MVSLQRWQRAQAGESESWAHEETWDASDIRAYFEGEFGTDISTFANEKILVVGSGTGVVHTLSIDCYAVGVDPLTNDFLDVIEDSDAHLITGVGERLPFAANTFDAVWTFNVINHMRNPKGAIDEMYRVVQLGVNSTSTPTASPSECGTSADGACRPITSVPFRAVTSPLYGR
jgi:ubiquinone/menaquinone biosynthesis C-methylase UbiE